MLAARRWPGNAPHLSVEAFLRVCREGGLMGFDTRDAPVVKGGPEYLSGMVRVLDKMVEKAAGV